MAPRRAPGRRHSISLGASLDAWHGADAEVIGLAGTRDTAESLLMEHAEPFQPADIRGATADVLGAASMPVLMTH